MPGIDLSALNAAQTASARARLALDKAENQLASAQAELSRNEAALARAARAGNRAAIDRARLAVEKSGTKLGELRVSRDDLNARLRDALESLARLALDAPGEVPLLLLPLRLETRFARDAANKPVLRIRIYPDDIHIDRNDPGLREGEAEAGRAYWATLFSAPDDSGIDAPWAVLRARTGASRARAVALATRPLNPAARGTGQAPEFPPAAPASRSAARPRLLPERFRVTAWQGNTMLRATGSPVSQELKIGLVADDGSALTERDGLRVLEGAEWLSDYAAARAAGMAIDLPLGSESPISRLFVYGTCQSRSPAQSVTELESLLAAHDGAGLLNFVPQGTATNNTEAGEAGWRRWRDPLPVPLVPPALPEASNGRVAATALGISAAALAGADQAAAREQLGQRAMNAALWPATWGYFLETLDERQQALTPQNIDDARLFHQAHVRGGGPLPALAIGSQPYGILPVAGAPGRAARAGTTGRIDRLLAQMWPNWRNGVADLPRITGQADTEALFDIFGLSPLSWGLVARKCLSHDFVQKAGGLTTQAASAAQVEALLNALLAEQLGFMSETLAFNSIDTERRPVMLPYADPARDAAFIRALLAGTATGQISSVLQALIALGWSKLRLAANPPGDLAGALRGTVKLDPALTEKVISLVVQAQAQPTRTPRRATANTDVLADYDATLARLPASTAPPRDTAVPLTLARDLVGLTLGAQSVNERDHYGIILANATLRAARGLAAMRTALDDLATLAEEGQPDLTTLVAQTLDCASHRLDAWITGIAGAQLSDMRAKTPGGLSIGAYGWLFDLQPQRRGSPAGGYIAAPTLEQATTAGLLRSAWLAHNAGAGAGGAFAIDLSSARVRQALALSEGVANGQPLGALLGYAFERRLSDANCERFILSLRGLAPLRPGRPGETGNPVTDEEAQAVAAANVVDMLVLLARWEKEGAARILDLLIPPPRGNEYLDPAHWKPPSAAERKAITGAVTACAAEADALADLMMAESVHQLAQGNLARAAATMDAAGKGEAAPPAEPDFVLSRGPGALVSHRLVVALADGPGWDANCPRAAASPQLEAWAAARLPAPARILLGRGAQGRVTLADCHLSALDFAALCEHPPFLERLIRSRAPLSNPGAAFPTSQAELGPDGIALEDAVLMGAALQAVIAGARPLGALNIGPPGATGWQPAPGAPEAAMARLTAAASVLQVRAQVLGGLLDSSSVTRDALMTALLDLSDFGVIFPDLSDSQTAGLASLAFNEAVSRLNRTGQALTAPASPEAVATAAEALFGQGFVLPLPHIFVPPTPGQTTGERAFTTPAPGTIERYLADFGTVRRAVGAFQRMALLAGSEGRGPAFTLRQLCGTGNELPDSWIGDSLPADRRPPDCALASLLIDAPQGVDLTRGITGLLIDEWTETLPERRPIGGKGAPAPHTAAGVAIHADAPGAEPPQSLLLALSPDGARWTEDSLCSLLDDTIELARTRLVTLETVPLAARLLPAIYTQSWSLQGEPVIDWSKIVLSKTALARTAGLRNFTMTKEA